MSAVDAPRHAGLGGRAAGEFGARSGPRRLAVWATRWVAVTAAIAAAVASRQPLAPGASTIVVLAMMFAAIALVGRAVRSARVTIEPGGIRWGWSWLSLRMDVDRLERIVVYRDAIALVPARGSTWFLSARDWERFDAMVRAVERAGLPPERAERPAPLVARLQSYGRVLDGMLLLSMLGTALLLVAAAGL